MFRSAEDVANWLTDQGFIIQGKAQEEDPEKFLDAEIQISPNVVIQIDWQQPSPEYGVTVEPHRAKREYSNFRHIGYFKTLDTLVSALQGVCTKQTTKALG